MATILQLGYILLIPDKPQYKHVFVSEKWIQTTPRCPICGSRIRASTLMPEILGGNSDRPETVKELGWSIYCENEDCSSGPKSILFKTDNPVPISIIDEAIDQFLRSLGGEVHG